MEDSKIIALFWQRNEQAVKETDTAYGGRLYSLSNHILRNPEDAQECVNDTYMETWNSIPPRKPTYFYAYLAAICRHLSLDRLDWRMAAKRNVELVTLSQEMENCIPDRRQEAEFDRRELYADTVAEIAARYSISESKVKTQLHRTRKKLLAVLNKEGITV